jgi:glycosyltransferase involved in cell wall biosynthesis
VKILWLAPEPPSPPLTGGRERARFMLGYLADRHEVHLFTHATADEIRDLGDLHERLVGVTWKPYNRGTARRARKTIQDLIASFRPDALHAQGSSMLSYIPRSYTGKRVYDCHDAPDRPREEELIRKTPLDTLITVSPEDARGTQPLQPTARSYVLPNGVDLDYWSSVSRSPKPQALLFPAALHWPPNDRGAQEFIAGTLPIIQESLPSIECIFAGKMPSTDLYIVAGDNPGVEIVPNPPDMCPLFAQATIIIVPIEKAGGTRLKILQALAAKCPVVSTPAGAQGLNLTSGKHLIVSELGRPMADSIVELIRSPAQQEQLIRSGHEIISDYAWQHFLPVLDEVYPQ